MCVERGNGLVGTVFIVLEYWDGGCSSLRILYIHTFIHSYINTYIHTYIHKYIHTCT